MAATRNAPLPACSHRPTCPGCPRYGEPGIGADAARRLGALAEHHSVELAAPVEAAALGYRHRVRLMVRGRVGAPKVGLFQTGSHRIADVPHCRVHHARVNEAAAALKAAMRATSATPYADGPHRGLVRALQCVVERESQTLQTVVVTRSDTPEPARELLDALRAELGDRLHSLWWNGNPERTNTILGPRWERVVGEPTVRERIGGADVYFPPGAFGQSHLALADRLVDAVHAEVPPGAAVVELYAGCGAIGLGLLARGHAVAFNESAEAGLAGLAQGVARLEAETRQRARVLPGRAGDHAATAAGADVVIVDPPRRGLDAELASALASDPPAKLVYVSGDAVALERDVATLTADAGLRLVRLAPYALLPFTEHVETLAVLERVTPPSGPTPRS